jgi:hypothetical protein
LNREIAQALADALAPTASAIETNGDVLLVEPWFVLVPAGPTIDIYPGDPFEEGLGFGDERSLFWTVRVRVHTIEHQGAQSVLLDLMEPFGATSVEEALLADLTLGGLVDTLGIEGPTAYTTFVDQAGVFQNLGVSWRVQVMTKPNFVGATAMEGTFGRETGGE